MSLHRLSPSRRTLRLHPLAACLVSTLLLQAGGVDASAAPAPRGTLVVQNCDDAGAGSLRDVVAGAGDGAVVDMSALACGTITLTSGAIVPAVGTLTIQGPGSAALSIDGGNTDRVIRTTQAGTLTLVGLTMTHGTAPDYGGCLQAAGNAVLTDVTAVACAAGSATAGSTSGGGAFVAGDATTSASTFANNTVDGSLRVRGGGLAVGGALTDTGSSFTGNHATSHSVPATQFQAIAEGGGVHALAAADLTDSVVSGNTASSDAAETFGGGLAVGSRPDNSYASLDLIHGTVTGNRATSQCGVCPPQGGGVAVVGDTLLRDSNVSGNTVGSAGIYGGAGGIRVFRATSVEIDTSTISGNHADSAGGGMIASEYGNLTIDASTISGNDAGNQGGTNEGGGGVLCLACALTVTSSVIDGNIAGADGGGIMVAFGDYAPGPPTILDSTISGNTANEGAGVMFDGGHATVSNSAVAFNQGTTRGAGISASYYSYTIELQSTIVSNNMNGASERDVFVFGAVDGANNLIPNAGGSPAPMPGDTITADPLLQPLTSNGGATMTHALGEGSPAIDAGNDVAGLVFDQRGDGYPREVGASADIGAFEVQAAPPPAYHIGGTVTGLASEGLVLQQNGGDDLSIAADGSFTFTTPVPDGATYDVTILAQPVTETCVVDNGSGTVAGGDVTTVQITCEGEQPVPYTVGGHVSGLLGSGLVLQNDGGDDLPIAADGDFTFAVALDDGSPYAVTIFAQPTNPAQTCTVANGTGAVDGANVTDIAVTCSTDILDRVFADGFDGEGSGGATTLSQTIDMTPVALNSAACGNSDGLTTSDNQYWRRYYFNEYGISTAANVASVDVSVEMTTGAPTVTVTLYTIPHSVAVDTIDITQLTQIGQAAMATDPDAQMVTMNVPVTGAIADTVGTDLVVEVSTDDGSLDGTAFYIGSTTSPETHLSFLSSAGCGVTDPIPTADIGYPDMHIIEGVNITD